MVGQTFAIVAHIYFYETQDVQKTKVKQSLKYSGSRLQDKMQPAGYNLIKNNFCD